MFACVGFRRRERVILCLLDSALHIYSLQLVYNLVN